MTLYREKAFPVALSLAETFFDSSVDFEAKWVDGKGMKVFSTSNSTPFYLTLSDFRNIIDIFETDPYSHTLRKSWDRGNKEEFEAILKKAVDQFFPSFDKSTNAEVIEND